MNEHDDHGLQWRRLAGREHALTSGFILMVSAPAPNGGYMWGVLREDNHDVVDNGKAPTRGEARRLAVFALAEHLGIATPDPFTPPPAELMLTPLASSVSPALRRAAASVLFALFALFVIATIIGIVR